MNDAALPFSPAAERNQGPILEVLASLWPSALSVLEIASGTGQHAAHFAAAQPGWDWQPSDRETAARAAIDARCAALANVRAALALDVLQPWPTAHHFDALFNANMLHISPWATCASLMQGAAVHLKPDGTLVLYGPFIIDGEATAPSNLAFDADLRRRDPAWGLRDLSAVVAAAQAAGLLLQQRIAMPANNQMLVLVRTATA